MLGDLDFWWILALGAGWTAWAPLRWREAGLAAAAFGLLALLDWRAALTYAALTGLTWRVARSGRRRLGAAVVAALATGLAGTKLLDAATNDEMVVALGLSYLVFKLIHVALDAVSRPPAAGGEGFAAFLHYALSPAMLAAGPIQRWDDFQNGRQASLDGEILARALWRIGLGVVKKLVVADWVLPRLAGRLDVPFAEALGPELGAGVLWLTAAYFYLRVYVEFSGYSDIAVGAGLLWGRRLMENFSWPILATNPSDFWRRWHISLSQWCSRQVYMPLIGLTRVTWVAMFASFLVMGLWHYVGWNRVGWAAYQTLGVLVFVAWQRRLGRPAPGSWRASRAWRAASLALTQVFVVLSYVFAMAGENAPLHETGLMWLRMVGLR